MNGCDTHLRSTEHPQAERTGRGRFLVQTECGKRMDAVMVDNEHATCLACCKVDQAIAEER